MNETTSTTSAGNLPPAAAGQTIVVQTQRGGWWARFLAVGLAVSVMLNISLYGSYREYFEDDGGPTEHYHSGSKTATERLAILRASGTIMPPLTGNLLKMIAKADEDDRVKAVLLVVDSPGGLVADSHQIYHRLQQLARKKPVYVAMQRIAASGGYYIAMGAGPEGRIFAEPTTWTGSIGVIIPRYEFGELAEKLGIQSAPLKTGPYKDALNPFQELSEGELAVWTDILNQSFEQFLTVIDDNRDTLDREGVRELATGQVYTAKDAIENGLVDEIGYVDDALKALQEKIGLPEVRIVEYEAPISITSLLLGQAETRDPHVQWQHLLDMTVPRAMYYCSWLPLLSTAG